jgi:RNA polymerase sigma factor (sigma-70 family)
MSAPDLDTIGLTDLLTRARDGDTAARDNLLARAQTRLERLARKMLRDFPGVRRWEDTADVLQEALIRLVRALDAVNPETTRQFFGLAGEQVRRTLLDLARHYQGAHGHGRHYRSGVSPGPGETPAVPDRADESDPDDLDRWTAFHEAVEQLPVEEREVFMLAFYQGWTQPQIAQLFEVDERTVRRRWRSATEKLQTVLGAFPGEE